VIVLNVAKLPQALADLYAGSIYSIWTVYWVDTFLLNCLLIDLNVFELSQALTDLYAVLFCSIWTVYWVNGFILNCLLIALNVVKLSQVLNELCVGWFYSIWTAYLVIFTELSTGCLKCCKAVTGSSWFVFRVILLYLNSVLRRYILTELLLVVLNVAKLSQALAPGWYYIDTLFELSIGWVESYWTANWMSWMLLNCHRL